MSVKAPPFEEAPFLDTYPPQGGNLGFPLSREGREFRGSWCPPKQAPESQHRKARVRSPGIEAKRTCEKDVKNRENELNNSFGINKSVKKANSKRTDFACKKEQLEAKKEQTARERGGSRLEQKMPILYSNICFKQSFDERLQGNWPTVRLVFRGNKARMSMKTKDRQGINHP